MPSPFKAAKRKPQGGLDKDLQDTKRDIRRLKRGGEAEVSLDEAQQTKRDIKDKIKAEVKQEREAMMREMAPPQMAEPRMRPKMTTA